MVPSFASWRASSGLGWAEAGEVDSGSAGFYCTLSPLVALATYGFQGPRAPARGASHWLRSPRRVRFRGVRASPVRAAARLPVVALPPEGPLILESLGMGKAAASGAGGRGRACHLPGLESGSHHMQACQSPVWTAAHGREQ